VRAEPTSTHTAGIDTSPRLGSPCRSCHELSVICGQKLDMVQGGSNGKIPKRGSTAVGKINTTNKNV